MHVFYTPDILVNNELPEEEAQHCLRVLRLSQGDQITLTDGKGSFFQAEISMATGKRCYVNVIERTEYESPWGCRLHLAVAPTKKYGPQ